ncbi:MAG: hypothetical protein IJN11_09040 [Oscillospiraceae bacterium]|nr:hypothetical protein [Oscillospiraceae bacterium]MBQ7014037.1 hypothetical protein [Oscillospiraceae bacterium]
MDYQYITEEDIRRGYVVVTDNAVLMEVNLYNTRMEENRRRKKMRSVGFSVLLFINIVILILSGMFIKNLPLYLILTGLYLVLFVFLIGIKRFHHPVIGCAITLMLIPMHLIFGILTVMNGIVCLGMMRSTGLEQEPGYPDFRDIRADYRKEEAPKRYEW